MNHYFLPLTNAESKNVDPQGWAFAKANRARWVDMKLIGDEIDTYDFGKTHPIVNDVVYEIVRDYVDITKGERIYVGLRKDLDYDVVT